MTNQEILDMHKGLSTLKYQDDLQFPVKVAFAITRNLKTLTPIVEDIMATRTEIGRKYGVMSEDQPGYFVIKPENMAVADKELKDLASMSCDIGLYKIKLEDIEGMSLSIQDMENLYPLLEEE